RVQDDRARGYVATVTQRFAATVLTAPGFALALLVAVELAPGVFRPDVLVAVVLGPAVLIVGVVQSLPAGCPPVERPPVERARFESLQGVSLQGVSLQGVSLPVE